MKTVRGLKFGFNNAGHILDDNDVSDIVANLSSSTNNVFINSLYRQGFDQVYQFNSSNMGIDTNGASVVDAVRLKVSKNNEVGMNPAIALAYGDLVCSYLDTINMNIDEFDVVFIRGDDLEPDSNAPVLFRKAKDPLYINSVDATLATKDKFQVKIRAEKNGIKIPQTCNVENFQELLNAIQKISGEYKVIKARYGYGGKFVWKVNVTTPIHELEEIFGQCEGGVVVQEYKSIIEKGDLRVCLFDGDILGDGAILRRAASNTWKTNIDLGGSQYAYVLDEKMKEVARLIGDAYKEVRLQGVDLLLDGTMLETNAFPSTVGYIYGHFGIRAEDIIIERIVKEIAGR